MRSSRYIIIHKHREAAGRGSRFLSFLKGFGLTLLALILIGLTALNGLCGLALIRSDRPAWNRHRLVTGMALSVLDVAAMIAARQPYAGLLCFALLTVKAFGILKLR